MFLKSNNSTLFCQTQKFASFTLEAYESEGVRIYLFFDLLSLVFLIVLFFYLGYYFLMSDVIIEFSELSVTWSKLSGH